MILFKGLFSNKLRPTVTKAFVLSSEREGKSYKSELGELRTVLFSETVD